MSFYQRKIKYYKSFRLVDTTGDNVRDTIVYKPYSENYFLQVGLEQEIKNIGHYNLGVNDEFEIVDFSSIWGENGSGIINDGTYTPPPLSDPQGGDDSSATLPTNEFCNDETATNYEPNLVGVAGFSPCANNQCCTYLDLGNYSFNAGSGDGTGSIEYDCLALYTDWGPWNPDLILNDTEQIYVTAEQCSLTFRLWNINNTEPNISNLISLNGGWYGATIEVEINDGSGFQTLSPTSPLIESIDSSIEYNGGKFTLGDDVKIFLAKKSILGAIEWYSTIPFRDFTITPPPGSTVRITYRNGISGDYQPNASKLKLQLFKGKISEPKPIEPYALQTYTVGSSWSWSTPYVSSSIGYINPTSYDSAGNKFVFIGEYLSSIQAGGSAVNDWLKYLKGTLFPTETVPWFGQNTSSDVGNFYNVLELQNIEIFGATIASAGNISPIVSDTNFFSNPSEEIYNQPFECTSDPNPVSYFDKNGDGFIESDQNYPTVDPTNGGSVDTGLFSRTRYDSPYIYIKPGTSGGNEPLTSNLLISVTPPSGGDLITNPTSAGWRGYRFNSTNSIEIVSPTCQLSGVDNDYNTVTELTETSNVNIFLPQPDYLTNPIPTSAANFNNGALVPHFWNFGDYDARGGCCAKVYDPSLEFDSSGPYLKSRCSRCHGELTTRSAQPVFDNDTKIKMQMTGSDTYYGPFYDPQNPSYNGYGLAFSKATNFCRNEKSKNGVRVITTNPGNDGFDLSIGGIIHGGAKEDSIGQVYTNNNTQNFQWNEVDCNPGLGSNSKKLPLKCEKVSTNDSRCPSGNCMKCIYCFSCSNEPIGPSVFTGDNSTGGNNGGGVVEIPSVNLVDGVSGPVSFNTGNNVNDPTAGNFNGYIEIAVNNPNNSDNFQITTGTVFGTSPSDETEVTLTIINQVTSAVITTITYTVPYTDGTSTYTESINLPIGTYLYTLEQNFTFNAIGVTQLSLI
jgi:hypothetical protein